MTDTLGDLLRRSADAVTEPRVDVGELVARAVGRQRRRRLAVASTTAALVAAVAVGAFVVRGNQPHELEPAPSPSPSPSPPSSVAVDPSGTRPLVYAEGRTVHVGDRTVEAEKPVAFIDVTDDGVVYEAALDCTLWFTNGTTTSVIGTSPWTAAPTAHVGNVVTGDSGSLVVWADVHGCKNQVADDYVVYDTSKHEVVGRIPFVGGPGQVLHVDDGQVYFNPGPDTPGCWVVEIQDIHHCASPHLYRFDVSSGATTRIDLPELYAVLGSSSRTFVVAEPTGNGLAFLPGATFGQVGRALVHVDPDGQPAPLARADGAEVRLHLPDGWISPQPDPQTSGGMIQVSQWVDDDTVVLWADDGGGDLPAKHGDLLVCRLPDGSCRVSVARSAHSYVAPWRPSE